MKMKQRLQYINYVVIFSLFSFFTISCYSRLDNKSKNSTNNNPPLNFYKYMLTSGNFGEGIGTIETEIEEVLHIPDLNVIDNQSIEEQNIAEYKIDSDYFKIHRKGFYKKLSKEEIIDAKNGFNLMYFDSSYLEVFSWRHFLFINDEFIEAQDGIKTESLTFFFYDRKRNIIKIGKVHPRDYFSGDEIFYSDKSVAKLNAETVDWN